MNRESFESLERSPAHGPAHVHIAHAFFASAFKSSGHATCPYCSSGPHVFSSYLPFTIDSPIQKGITAPEEGGPECQNVQK